MKKPWMLLVLSLICFFDASFAFSKQNSVITTVVERTPVPVIVNVSNQYWVETISICNNSSKSIPLNDIEFNFNYSIPMPSNIWGQPWAAWRVASQQGTKVALLGGAPYSLKPDPNCANPLTIQFNAAPDAPAPTGPFVFLAAGVTPPGDTGNLTTIMPAAPEAGLSTPQVTVKGMGQTLNQSVNWGTRWQLNNLAAGTYSIISSTVNNGTHSYQAAPIDVTISPQQTTEATVKYTVVPSKTTGNLTINMPSQPAAGLNNPKVTVTGMEQTYNQTVNWGTSWRLTDLAAGPYTVTASPVNNGTNSYQAAPINAEVKAEATTQVSVVYTQSQISSEYGNGTWVYDTTYDSNGRKTGSKPGLFAANINQYNNIAGAGHKITQIFSYGGDMEMFCKGSGGASSSTPCTASNMKAFYSPETTTAYFNAANETSNPVSMYPVLDGVVGGPYLTTFNNLTEAEASIYADNVASLYCADDNVSGVSFDLEPFDISKPGQAFFFAQIAKNFAGQHNGPDQPDPYHCVNAAHPQGRTFSVFTTAGHVNSALATIFNKYGNGFVIDSLYDLGPNAGGVANSLENYTKYVNAEVTKMMKNAQTYNVKYQFAVPASASVHEFETVNGQSSGVKQIDYLQAAMNAINDKNARQDPLFLGIDIWAWNQMMIWSGKTFTPALPSSAVLNYLASSL
ncbi:hypothetical protein [Legionella jordanis]|uniref:Chitinase n=1 Tax=Legionella jordanis TaxID=456 RepID=A0A0W0VG66_9GAMM|nr:hypothetical protein [Legionella jordanis]KTD19090.1 hypothetical protein Ljor_0056 [Legionella jordanis]RMW99312.1 hypothetical protein EAW55_13995 [Legionella jordanis]VEH12946.1 Uncharacterised protein [Legionella jordanis]HAT8715281.1 hypothetical protein [Legionella jordanis]